MRLKIIWKFIAAHDKQPASAGKRQAKAMKGTGNRTAQALARASVALAGLGLSRVKLRRRLLRLQRTQGDGSSVLTDWQKYKHLEKQLFTVHSGIHITPVAVKTRFINRLDVLQRKHQGGYCLWILMNFVNKWRKKLISRVNKADKEADQLALFDPKDPFTGGK